MPTSTTTTDSPAAVKDDTTASIQCLQSGHQGAAWGGAFVGVEGQAEAACGRRQLITHVNVAEISFGSSIRHLSTLEQDISCCSTRGVDFQQREFCI